MTNYEQKVTDNLIPPMNSMDALMISMSVEEAIKNNFVAEEEKLMLLELWDEIEYLFSEDLEKLTKIKNLLGK
ncbi:MAG: hypothetical protein ABIP51_20850 [Bacteroidia bacterium]